MSNPAKVGYRLRLSFIGLAIGFSLPSVVSAESATLHLAPDVPPAPPAHLVRELLEEDARRALINERLSHASSVNPASGSTTVGPTLAISALETGNSNPNSPAVPVKSAPSVRLKALSG